MNAIRARRWPMCLLIPCSVACCLGAFCAQPMPDVRFALATQIQHADADWPRAASTDPMPLAAR